MIPSQPAACPQSPPRVILFRSNLLSGARSADLLPAPQDAPLLHERHGLMPYRGRRTQNRVISETAAAVSPTTSPSHNPAPPNPIGKASI